jgi:hypothetical protein
MNAQHVVAREYGFKNWDELIHTERWNLVAALIEHQSKQMTNPMQIWYPNEGGTQRRYPSPERYPVTIHKLGDYVTRCLSNTQSVIGWLGLDVNTTDISGFDLSKCDVLRFRYNELTQWPEDPEKMPKDFNPKTFLEERKNPGMGIRALHKQGVTGKGRNVAVISSDLLRYHLEYMDSLADHIVSGEQIQKPIPHAGEYVSMLVGKNCGIAPQAKCYYYQTPKEPGTLKWYAQALNMACDKHENLVKSGKNGFDVICITATQNEGDTDIEEMQEAIARAESLGIWVNFGKLSFPGCHENWQDANVYCPFGKDVDLVEDYVLWNKANAKSNDKDTLCFPSGGRTVAYQYRLDAYIFTSGFEMGKNLFECGIYLLGKSVKPSLTPAEFWKLALETGTLKKGVGVIITPQALINALKK